MQWTNLGMSWINNDSQASDSAANSSETPELRKIWNADGTSSSCRADVDISSLFSFRDRRSFGLTCFVSHLTFTNSFPILTNTLSFGWTSLGWVVPLPTFDPLYAEYHPCLYPFYRTNSSIIDRSINSLLSIQQQPHDNYLYIWIPMVNLFVNPPAYPKHP